MGLSRKEWKDVYWKIIIQSCYAYAMGLYVPPMTEIPIFTPSYTVGRNTYKFRMNNMCNTFFLFEHIILLLENCTDNKDTSFKSWIQPYEKHIDLIEMTIERMDPCSVQ